MLMCCPLCCTVPCCSACPAAIEDGRRRVRANVTSAPKDNLQQQWPTRGLKKVDSAPKDNKEVLLFERYGVDWPAANSTLPLLTLPLP
jgi:hypothetical protein